MMQSARKPYPIFFSYLGYLIFSVFLAAAVLEIGSAIVRTAYHWIHPRKAESLSSDSPAYQGYPWAKEFWKEEHARWSSSKGLSYVPFLFPFLNGGQDPGTANILTSMKVSWGMYGELQIQPVIKRGGKSFGCLVALPSLDSVFPTWQPSRRIYRRS
jgi:hypothetical protein